MESQNVKNTPPAVHAVCATFILCLVTVAYTYKTPDFARFFSGINDFLPRYTQALVVGTDQMYDIEAGYREQDRVVGSHILGALHDRLPWQALLMAPLARLPYLSAYWIWVVLNLAAFAGLVVVWLMPRDSVLWGAIFFPVGAALIVGQESILLALALAGVLRLAEKNRDTAGGLLLALCTAKPHLFVLVPLALFVHRRWRIAWSAGLGTAALLIVSTIAAGTDWPRRLWSIMKEVEGGARIYMMPTPNLFQFGVSPVTMACAFFLALLFAAIIWRTANLKAGIGVAVIGGFLIAPHTAIYDLPLLLVALPALPSSPATSWIRIALFTPLPYWATLSRPPWTLVLPLMLFAVVLTASDFAWAWPKSGRGEFCAIPPDAETTA